MSMWTQKCLCNMDFISLGYLPRSRIYWLYSISISNFLINCHAFYNGCAIYIPIRSSLSSISFLTLVFGHFIFCLLDSSPNRRWCLILVLICTFLMMEDEILPFVTTQVNLEDIMLKEVNNTQKKYCISHIWNLNNWTHKDRG
jgi:hypothetical protein